MPSIFYIALTLFSLLPLTFPPKSFARHPTRHARHYQIELLDEAHRSLPLFRQRGRSFVLGRWGERYLIRVRNREHRRVEVVLTVDGRDVINGTPGSYSNRGYVIDAQSELIIEGFRQSTSSVATFRFTHPGDSYAGRLGSAENVGVIGAAFFPERGAAIAHRVRPSRRRDGASLGRGERTRSMGAPAHGGADAASDVAGAALRSGAASVPPSRRIAPRERRLGTRYGEQRHSESEQVPFIRASQRPTRRIVLYYDNEAGLEARGITVRPRPEEPSPFPREPRFAPPPPR